MKDASEKALSEVRKLVEVHAVRAGYDLNPVRSIKEATLKGLAHNLELFGRPYCTCLFVSEELLKDQAEAEKIVCPCADHAGQIAEQGCCHCGLFLTKGTAGDYLKGWAID